MKTASLLGLLLVSSILLFSCKKEATPPEQSTVTVTKTDTLQPLKTESNSEAVALNPPHGQPNHRCDIAVGAPLNSLPSPSSLLNSTPQTPTSPTNNTGIKPATNPAHGQPYHRCDLKVGDPLPDA